MPQYTGGDRRNLFVRGFGDGAKGSAMKHKDQPDYMEGYRQGAKALVTGTAAYINQEGLPPPTFLRLL